MTTKISAQTQPLFTLTDGQITVAQRPDRPLSATTEHDLLAVHTHVKAGPFVYYEGEEDPEPKHDHGTWDTD